MSAVATKKIEAVKEAPEMEAVENEPTPEPKHAGVSTPQSPAGSFQLPCGYLDPSGTVHTEVSMTELNGEDEDLMFSPIPSVQIVDKILARRIESLGTLPKQEASKVVRDLLSGDRVYLMIALRRLSCGDGYSWIMRCPECNEKSKVDVDLTELKVKGMHDPKARVFNETLPSGATVQWKAMNGHMEGQRDKIRKKMQNDRPTLAILLRLTELNGKPNPTMPEIKKLSSRDRNHMRNSFNKNEGGMDTDVQIECPSCNVEVETMVDVTQPSFFFPTET